MSLIHTPPGRNPEPGPAYLESTRFFDWKTEPVRRFAEKVIIGETTDIGRAVKLFYAVRDGWRYDPFSMRLTPEMYVASNILRAKSAYCIPKAILLGAAARAVGIQAAIGLSDVVNHLTTEKLKERLGGLTYFMYHGYAVMYLEVDGSKPRRRSTSSCASASECGRLSSTGASTRFSRSSIRATGATWNTSRTTARGPTSLSRRS